MTPATGVYLMADFGKGPEIIPCPTPQVWDDSCRWWLVESRSPSDSARIAKRGCRGDLMFDAPVNGGGLLGRILNSGGAA